VTLTSVGHINMSSGAPVTFILKDELRIKISW